LKVKADFVADWTAHLRTQLVAYWGASKVGLISDSDVPVAFFETAHRRIEPRRRELKTAREFSCPAEWASAWEVLKLKVLRGENVNPHLSKRHASLSNPDGLLSEWDVHHLHLGTVPDARDPFYVKRTEPFVFARVTPDTFYAIGVYDHKGQYFEDTDVIERVHYNWPESIQAYLVKSVTGTVLEKHSKAKVEKRKRQCIDLNAGRDRLHANQRRCHRLRTSDIFPY
jgi:hypothetical protein